MKTHEDIIKMSLAWHIDNSEEWLGVWYAAHSAVKCFQCSTSVDTRFFSLES